MPSFELTTKTIFDASTAQVTTPVAFDLRQEVDERYVTVVASGLANFENIYVWVSLDGGSNYVAYNIGGVQVKITNKNNVLRLEKDVYYGFTKDATASAVTCKSEYMARTS